MGEEELKQFKECLLNLLRILVLTTDSFFYRKLDERINKLSLAFLKIAGEPAGTDVAQYNLSTLTSEINLAIELLESMDYLKTVSPAPLAISAVGLLKLKLLILKKSRSERKMAGLEKQNTEISALKKTKTAKLEADSNKEKILKFIKQFPDVRTKDIIDEFNGLSERTVKRNLKELMEEGFLRKRMEDRAVFYSVGNIS